MNKHLLLHYDLVHTHRNTTRKTGTISQQVSKLHLKGFLVQLFVPACSRRLLELLASLHREPNVELVSFVWFLFSLSALNPNHCPAPKSRAPNLATCVDSCFKSSSIHIPKYTHKHGLCEQHLDWCMMCFLCAGQRRWFICFQQRSS